MKGYWNRPEETAAAFVDGWFLTGDIGYMDEDGFFFIVDRNKDMIISGGFNVYPRMIEEAIYEHPDVEECVVDRRPGRLSRRGREGLRQAARRAPRRFTLEELRAFLADKLGRHEMPARAGVPRRPPAHRRRQALEEGARRGGAREGAMREAS